MTNFNLSIILKLTNDAFDLEGLTDFCFLHFRPVYDQFQETDRKSARVRMLIDHAERKGQLADLLALIRAENPGKYAQYADQFGPAPSTPDSPPQGQAGIYIAGDVHGDVVGGDKVGGDKVAGDNTDQRSVSNRSVQTVGNQYNVAGDLHVHHSESSGTTIPSTLPDKTYGSFVGRSDHLDEVMNALRNPKRIPVMAIVGLGGIGKTALARKTVELSAQEKLFEHIVWISFKAEYFVSEKIIEAEAANDNFAEVLSDIGRQCNRLDIAKMPPDQKLAAVKYLLASKRVLVVLDNLETASDEVALVAAVVQILGQSKLLLTSRHQVKHDQVFTLDLSGLPEDEGVNFLRQNGKERNVVAVVQADRPQLVKIHTVTGGAPLAMKLVIGQISRQPLTVVLGELQKASFKGQDYEFYRFVYQHSWDTLEMPTQMALVDMSVFPPLTGGAVADVQAVSQVEEAEFWPAMDQLVTMSLVDKIGVVGKERYALHPLTQYFIRSDITKEWAER